MRSPHFGVHPDVLASSPFSRVISLQFYRFVLHITGVGRYYRQLETLAGEDFQLEILGPQAHVIIFHIQKTAHVLV